MLRLLLATDSDGRPNFVIWPWPCHPIASPKLSAVCADFPGAARSHLRDRLNTDDLPVLFLPGFCGDIRPDVTTSRPNWRSLIAYALHFKVRFGKNTSASFNDLCHSVCAGLDTALENLSPQDTETAVRASRVDVPLTDLISGAGDTAGSMPIQYLQSGNFRLLMIGAEVCSPYYGILDCVDDRILVTGYLDRSFGYLPSDAQIAEGGYESHEFFAPFSLKGTYRPKIEQIVAESVRDLQI